MGIAALVKLDLSVIGDTRGRKREAVTTRADTEENVTGANRCRTGEKVRPGKVSCPHRPALIPTPTGIRREEICSDRGIRSVVCVCVVRCDHGLSTMVLH